METKAEQIRQYPKTPGVVKITHIPTNKFFLINSSNIYKSTNDAHRSLIRGDYHCKELMDLIGDMESEISYSYRETTSKEQARELKHVLMRKYFDSPLLLNRTDWPKITGGFKITHKVTGKFYVGYGKDMEKIMRHQFHVLSSGNHKSVKFQELWNSDPNRDSYHVEWCICNDVKEAAKWKDLLVKSGDINCLNHERYGKKTYPGGVYKLTHVPTGVYYIGSTAYLNGRVGSHFWNLKNKRHVNERLQEVYDSDPTGFVVWKEHTVDRDQALEIEQRLLDESIGDPLCCNVSTSATSTAEGLAKNEMIQRLKSIKMSQWRRDNPEKAKATTQAMMEARRKGVMWDGVEYTSLRKAWEANGKNWSLIYRRLKDPEDYDVYLLKEPKVRPTE